MSWLTDGHVAALAYQADVQARLDRDREVGPRECFEGCAHRDACARVLRSLCGGHEARLPWAVLLCDECEEWGEA